MSPLGARFAINTGNSGDMNAFITASIIAMLIIGVIVIAELIAVTVLLLSLRRLVQEVAKRVDPVLRKTSHLLSDAEDMTKKVRHATDRISARAEQVSDRVAERVDRTTGLMQQVVSWPIIGTLAMVAGVRRGVRTWRMIRRGRKDHRQPAAEPATHETLLIYRPWEHREQRRKAA